MGLDQMGWSESQHGELGNIEVTPWFHITPDLQIAESSRVAIDAVYITGFRAQLDFSRIIPPLEKGDRGIFKNYFSADACGGNYALKWLGKKNTSKAIINSPQ